MKVNNKNGPSVSDIDSRGAQAIKGNKKNGDVKGIKNNPLDTSAKVDVSEGARLKSKATEIAKKGLNDIDEAKVAKYQSLIDKGEYKVDAEELASKLVDEHLLMS